MDIDSVKINFSEDSLVILNICLAILMFGIALDIKRSDFQRIMENPKTVIVGLISEYLLLPILTILLILIIRPHPGLAMGMVLIACCPGGTTSNFMVHFAKANAALSVLLTSITTLGAIILTPLAFAFWTQFIPDQANLPVLSVSPIKMVLTIVQLILIPVLTGMFINEKYPNLTDKIREPIRYLSLFIFFSFVIGAVVANTDFILNYIHIVIFIVLLHNNSAFIIGYYFARLMRESVKNSRTIAIETGIQNTGLGLILVFNFFDGLGSMAMILACWGVWHLISGFSLAIYWRNR